MTGTHPGAGSCGHWDWGQVENSASWGPRSPGPGPCSGYAGTGARRGHREPGESGEARGHDSPPAQPASARPPPPRGALLPGVASSGLWLTHWFPHPSFLVTSPNLIASWPSWPLLPQGLFNSPFPTISVHIPGSQVWPGHHSWPMGLSPRVSCHPALLLPAGALVRLGHPALRGRLQLHPVGGEVRRTMTDMPVRPTPRWVLCSRPLGSASAPWLWAASAWTASPSHPAQVPPPPGGPPRTSGCFQA